MEIDPNALYRKTALVRPREPEGTESIRVETLEGPAIAEPGKHVVLTANTERAESWVIDREVFLATYEKAGDAGE